LSVEEVVGTIIVNETVFEASWIYNPAHLAKSKIEIKNRLIEYNDSNGSHAIIITGLYSFGLIKEKNELYFFDSHSRTPQGKPSENGKACTIKFSGIHKIQNLTDHICKFIDLKKITVEINDILCLKLTTHSNEVNIS